MSHVFWKRENFQALAIQTRKLFCKIKAATLNFSRRHLLAVVPQIQALQKVQRRLRTRAQVQMTHQVVVVPAALAIAVKLAGTI